MVAGCGGGGTSVHREAAISPTGKHVKVKVGGVPRGERTVRLVVITTRSGATLAMVPVRINGRGPYPFAVDTGASQSLIDLRLAQRLGLRQTGTTGLLAGVAGAAHGEKIAVGDWAAGKVRLPGGSLAALKLAGPDGKGPMGLLGSDVLSRFGRIAVDYAHSRLILDPKLRKP
jgi:predicted aspartyl protease